MFAESKKHKMEPTTGMTNRIVENTKIKGDVTAEADIRIDGTLDGSVTTSGKVVIGKSGKVTGKINCTNADIEGHFDGELVVENVLSLKNSANIEGDVTVGKLAVEPGANFNASCTMKGSAVKSIKGDGKQKEKEAERSA
ncbi:bactofilin family protein [Robertkochia aurantiaca]|uniref:bactofilin family protein n=1 Tax=Robertkochia aurantiaca TaxID=2873700 RepID=UPI001CC9E07A|nr:polymer-forming cytoskeletal protein [Robertkochia sp. 3YJGBD-33]